MNSYLGNTISHGGLWLVWSRLVQNELGESPYMDEIFHIPQAQAYCESKFDHWDSKITTPPGIYLVSYVASFLTNRCDASALRNLNLLALGLIFFSTHRLLHTGLIFRRSGAVAQERRLAGWETLNVTLFPPLFFFTALFYTDPWSTALVLAQTEASMQYFKRLADPDLAVLEVCLRRACVVGLGAAALLCRQTNLFWVVAFPAALGAAHFLPRAERKLVSCQEVIMSGRVHDAPVSEIGIENVLKLGLSLISAVFANPAIVAKSMSPYLLLGAGFACFVAVNGSVVLGDKSNHIATVHTAQVLYLSAYVAFFSLPLFVPVLLQIKRLRSVGMWEALIALVSTGLALAVIRFNSIVHPFILADNRHYVFYVFKIFRQWPLVQYALAPVYLASMVLVWKGVCARFQVDSEAKTKTEERVVEDKQTPVLLSTFVILASCSILSVVTAPLVEPRYFILPWILWRILYSQSYSTETEKWGTLGAESLWFAVINLVTGYLFLYRPFAWKHAPEEGLQRFIW